MPATFTRLETILRAWEDYWFGSDLLAKILMSMEQRLDHAREGALVNWSRFRPYLEKLNKTDPVPAELSRYAPPVNMEVPPSFLSLHALLAAWCQHGRVVYDISAETQRKLAAIPLSQECWTDIPFTCCAFAVTLAEPLLSGALGDQFDLIMLGAYQASAVCRAPSSDFRIMEIKVFRSRAGEYRPTRPKKCKTLQQWVATGDFARLPNELEGLFAETGKISSLGIIVRDEAAKNPIVQQQRQVPSVIVTAAVQKLVAQLCIYISRHPESLVPISVLGGDIAHDSIVRKAQVFTVR